MDFLIDESVPQRLVSYARQIARTRGYPVLIAGLQPAEDYEVEARRPPGLRSKLAAEMQEFREALIEGKERAWLLSEAADCLYYAACIDEVAPVQGKSHYAYVGALAFLHPFGIAQWEVEAAALGKYGYRASQPYNKPAETPLAREERDARENAAIVQALREADWPGMPLPEVADRYGIPLATLYAAWQRGDILGRKAGKTVLINLDDQETRRWLLAHRRS